MFKKLTHILSVAAVLFTAAMVLSLQSCLSDDGPKGPDIGVHDSVPVLKSIGVSSFISDSGIIRYRIISEDWFVYDKREPKYWLFEKGLYMEQFNRDFHVEAFISCDTAFYFYEQDKWELRGRVFVKNLKGETFRTSLLYWDRREHVVYSPAHMDIDGETQALHGNNFRSNEQMTDYLIHNSVGKFPLGETEETPQPDPVISAQMNDTTSNQQ